MEFKVKVGISNRHVHLTKDVYDQLFDKEFTKIKDLKQTGEFATDAMLTVRGPKGDIENVRVLGPFRDYCQVEVSASDAFKLGLNPPVRKSGSLENSESITLISEKGEISLENACILAQAHIHMNFVDLEKYGVKDDMVVPVAIKNSREGIIFAHIKASETGVLEFHIDRDEASAFLLNNDDELIVKL